MNTLRPLADQGVNMVSMLWVLDIAQSTKLYIPRTTSFMIPGSKTTG